MIKDVLENFAKFTGKHLWFGKFPKTPFFTERLWTTASNFSFSEAATGGFQTSPCIHAQPGQKLYSYHGI